MKIKDYAAMIWRIMAATGKGYRRHSLRHTGEKSDHREDKQVGETKLQRMARQRLLTVR